MTFVIAELGSNHDGSIGRALKLIDIAKEAGADAAKFQLIPPFQPEWVQILIDYCERVGIEFMATPFDQAGIEALKGKVKHWKIASTEGADKEFVKSVIQAAGIDTIYFSDGAVEDLPLDWKYASNVVRMSCVVKYPAEDEDYHFLNGKWGLSDHTTGITLAPLAVAAGAIAVEKHITDDKKREGPDHNYALEPQELKKMIQQIRLVERIKNNKKLTITTHVGRKLQWIP